MSRGPGQLEQRITELFAATKDRSLSVADICQHAFALGGAPASRAQRLSVTRAAHRIFKRIDALEEQLRSARAEAEAQAIERGHKRPRERADLSAWRQFIAAQEVTPAGRLAKKHADAFDRFKRVSLWRMTEMAGRRIRFHPSDYPVRVWAVSMQPTGLVWAEAEVISIPSQNVMVRYAGALARLNRGRLACSWAWWRAMMFVSSRTGRIAARLDALWWERYGRTAGGVPTMQMRLARAMELLGVPVNYTRDDVIAAFRRAAKQAHPDMGGSAELFCMLVEARDRLLASIGTSAPAPRMPQFAPVGVQLRYRVARRTGPLRLGSGQRRIGQGRRRLAGR